MSDGKPKLLVLASTFPRWNGDTEPAFVYELSRRLTNEFELTVLAPHAPGAATHEQIDGIRVVRFRYAPERLQRLAYDGGILANLRHRRWTLLLLPIFLLAELFAIIRLLRREQFHVIHAHWIVPQVLLARLARMISGISVPVLATSHGGDLYALKGRLGHALKSFALRGAKAVTSVSHPMKNHLRETFHPAAQTHVIPMGTDLQEIFTPPASSGQRRSGTLLFVGRLVEKKGVGTLIDALGIIAEQHSSISLDIIGDGPLRVPLMKQARDAGLDEHITFHGSMTGAGVARLMQLSEIFIMPSIISQDGDQEGFGLVIVEAMGCGCAVIASDLPVIRDTTTHRETGILVEPANPEQLAAAVLELLADSTLRDQLSRNALENVRRNFDWDIIASRYATLLKHISNQ